MFCFVLFCFFTYIYFPQLCIAPTNAAVQTFALDVLLSDSLAGASSAEKINFIDEGDLVIFFFFFRHAIANFFLLQQSKLMSVFNPVLLRRGVPMLSHLCTSKSFLLFN